MKTPARSLLSPSFWLCAGGVLAFTTGLAGGAFAAPEDKDKKPAPRAPMVSKKLTAGIEEKTGKTLTEDQLQQIRAANAARLDAIRAAEAKFLADVAKVSGLTVEDIKGIMSARKKEEGTDAKTEKTAKPAAD